MWTRYQTVGVWLFFASMLGAFLFGAYNHITCWFRPTTSHTCHRLAEAHAQFIDSAATIAWIELGAAAVRRLPRRAAR